MEPKSIKKPFKNRCEKRDDFRSIFTNFLAYWKKIFLLLGDITIPSPIFDKKEGGSYRKKFN